MKSNCPTGRAPPRAGRRPAPARFSLPETRLGLLPSAGGTTRLTRLVGSSRAKEVILAGRTVDADAALAWGIVHRVATDPRAEALAWARELAERDPVAVVMAKALIDGDESDGALARERQAEAVLYARKRGGTAREGLGVGAWRKRGDAAVRGGYERAMSDGQAEWHVWAMAIAPVPMAVVTGGIV